MSRSPQPELMTPTVAASVWFSAGVVLLLALALAFCWLVVKRKPLALVAAGALMVVGPSLLQVDRTWLVQRLTGDWLPASVLAVAAGAVFLLASLRRTPISERSRVAGCP